MMGLSRKSQRALGRHAIVAAVLAVIGCGGSDNDVADPPDPYVPPAEGAPACELSADCPDGTHCDLGECVQACNRDVACGGGQVCSARARCLSDSDAPDEDPAPDPSYAGRVSVAPIEVELAEADAELTLTLAGDPGSEEVRYRVEVTVPWLAIGQRLGTFAGSTSLTLSVDRTGLGVGTHDGLIIVHTSVGSLTIPVRLEQGLTAVYQGSFTYSDPRPLGTSVLRIELRETAGFASVRVDPSRSPLFPIIDDKRAATSATYEAGALRGSIVQRFGVSDLGEERIVDRDVGREFSFELSPTDNGGLAGTFEERWVGLLPMPVTVAGEIALARLPNVSPAEFTVGLPPALPINPSPNPPALDAACSDAARLAAGLPSGACAAGASVSELLACGDAIRDRGAKLESGTGLLITAPDRGYAEFTAACAGDLDSPSAQTPTSGVVTCIRPGNLTCAQALYGRAAQSGSAEGTIGVGMLASDRTGVATLLMNDSLVEAFRAPYETSIAGTAVESAMLSAFGAGQVRARAGLRDVFDPFVLETLRTTPPALAATGDWQPIRRTARLLSLSRQASERTAELRLWRGTEDPAALQQALSRDAVNLLVALVALGTIEQAQDAPATPELGLFAESLTALSRRFGELQDTIDPFGLPLGYVEFLYDPLMAGPDRSTNFQQVLAAHSIDLAAAENDEAAAEAAVRTYDSDVDALAQELDNLALDTDARLVDLCGPAPGAPAEPDLANCGSATGRIAIARSENEQALQNVQIALQRIQGLQQRVAIQRQRLIEVHGIRADTIAFIDANGDKIDLFSAADATLAATQEFLRVASNSSLLNLGAPTGMGVASAAITLIRGGIQVRKDQLYRKQQMHALANDARAEYVNGMAVIKEMLVQQDELSLEAGLASLAAATAALRVATLTQEVETVRAQADLRAQHIADPSRLINDPMFRVIRDRAVEKAIASHRRARRGMYLAARAFEFEINTSFPSIDTHLVPAVRATELRDFSTCMQSEFTEFRGVFGVPQTFTDEISLREDVFGIAGTITDDVTGQVISEAEQFRRRLLAPSNLGSDGTVGLIFATSLNPDNGVLSSGVCNDQIQGLQVKIIGDGQGDDQARVRIELAGSALMRSCESFRGGNDELITEYQLLPKLVEVQAGVNGYPSSAADTQLFGRALAASEWSLAIPPGSDTPQNADLDLAGIDDIVLRVEHSAISLSDAPLSFVPSCL
jgi:hypothetical protein